MLICFLITLCHSQPSLCNARHFHQLISILKSRADKSNRVTWSFAGQKTCMHVHGVFPYLFVPYDGTQPADSYLRRFAASLDKAINVANNSNANMQHVFKITLVSGMSVQLDISLLVAVFFSLFSSFYCVYVCVHLYTCKHIMIYIWLYSDYCHVKCVKILYINATV